MLLKKQTVWLLTMLSLVVVLSVYYITSPEQNRKELAVEQDKGQDETTAQGGEETATVESEEEGSVISSVASDEAFEALRLKLEEERSKMKETYTEKLAQTDLSSEERSKAYDEIKKLEDAAKKEAILETLIISMGYEDALVRADGENVRITVKSDKPSASKANEIIQVVKSEIGQLQTVAVTFQPTK